MNLGDNFKFYNTLCKMEISHITNYSLTQQTSLRVLGYLWTQLPHAQQQAYVLKEQGTICHSPDLSSKICTACVCLYACMTVYYLVCMSAVGGLTHFLATGGSQRDWKVLTRLSGQKGLATSALNHKTNHHSKFTHENKLQLTEKQKLWIGEGKGRGEGRAQSAKDLCT